MYDITVPRANKGRLDYSVVKLREVHKIRINKKWRLSDIGHFSSHVLLIIQGQGCLIGKEYSLQVHTGGVYSCKNEEELEMDCSCKTDMQLTVMAYDVYQQDDKTQYLHLSEVAPVEHLTNLSAHEMTWFMNISNSIHDYWYSEEELGRYRSQLLFQEALYWMAKNNIQNRSDTDSGLQLTKDYIDQHYNESLPLDKLCRMAGLSLKYYSELFKKQYGVSVTEYIASVRMEHAKRLMMDPDLKLREIAHLVGYPDEFYFSRKFKKMVGASPSAYKSGLYSCKD